MKIHRIALYMLPMLIGLSGCRAISNFDELSVMGAYSREKDTQAHLVQSIDDHYDALVKVIAQGAISDYKDKTVFVRNFGEPILKKNLNDGTEQWLYRYAIYKTAKDKVYVYFDRNGQQVKWEKLACPSLF